MDIEIDGDSVTADGFLVAKLVDGVPATVQERFRNALNEIADLVADEDSTVVSSEAVAEAREALETFSTTLETALEELNNAMPDFG